jgi:hypothetical protein
MNTRDRTYSVTVNGSSLIVPTTVLSLMHTVWNHALYYTGYSTITISATVNSK